MKKPNPSYIQVTKDFQSVLDKFGTLLYEKIAEEQPTTKEAFIELVEQTIETVLFPIDLDSAKLKYNELKLQYTKSGPLGETSYAASFERQDYARRKPSKPYKLTPKRKQQLERMQQAIAAWKTTAPDEQEQWKQAAAGFSMCGIHLFRGVYITLLINNLPIPIPFLPTQKILHYYRSR